LDKNLVEPVKEEVKRKVDGRGDNGPASRDESPRRRLFMDGDDARKIDKDRGYTSLPVDVRVELLQEATFNAARAEANNVSHTSEKCYDVPISTNSNEMKSNVIEKKRRYREKRNA
jgi:hypothetical protein